jgi:hypothetical protein
MMRKLILLLSAIYFVALVTLAMLVYRASPGPRSQEILGVGIGDYQDDAGIVFISGQRLHCIHAKDPQSLTSTCTIEVEGKLLEIHAQRNPPTHPNQLGGICDAFYNGKEWPCHIDSRTVSVNWFAYISEPLGLNRTQLDALRRGYFFENLPEQAFIAGIILVPILTMVIAVIATAIWLWPRARSRTSLALITLITAAIGIASLTGTFLLAALLTRGFWD